MQLTGARRKNKHKGGIMAIDLDCAFKNSCDTSLLNIFLPINQ
jgi:hypothetical protein